MPLRRTLGVSLALLMISASAHARTPGEHAAANHHARSSAKARTLRHAWVEHRHHGRTTRRHLASLDHHPALRPIGRRRVGVASWYALDGLTTASGERMDSRRLTAAHRSLPLLSYVKVTNLKNGRSVVVQINDRGPMSHRFIIDLSRRAARVLHMKKAGVARVAIQPVKIVPHQLVAINQGAAYPGD